MNRRFSGSFPRLGLVLPLLAFAALAPATARADETVAAPSDEAKKLFASGIALLQDPEGERVEEAYAQFKRAYELSHLPKILGNLGYCALRLERDGEAENAYREYLRLVPDVDPREKAQIQRDLGIIGTATNVTVELKGAVTGDIVVKDTRVPVRGSPVTNAYPATTASITLRVRPGHHVISAVVAGVERGKWELDAASMASVSHTFDLTPHEALPEPATVTGRPADAPPPAPPAHSNVGPWVLIGTGAAALVAGAVTSIVTAGKVSDLNDQRLPSGQFPGTAAFNDDRDSARTLATTSYVLLGVGGALAAGGIVWRVLNGNGPERATAHALSLHPACGTQGCSASLHGTF